MPVVLAAGAFDVIVCLALLLVAWAIGILLVKPMAWLLGKVPVIGGQLAQAVVDGGGAVAKTMQDWAKTGLDAFVQVIEVPAKWLGDVIGTVTDTVDGIVANIVIVANAVGQAIARTIANTINLANALVALVGSIAAVVASIPAIATRMAQAVAARLEAELRHVIAAAVAALADSIELARTLAHHLVTAAIALMTGHLAAAVAELTAAMHALALREAQAIGSIEAEIGQIGALVRPIAAAGLLTLVPAIAAELEALRRGCIDPTCSVVSPQIPTLTALMDIGTLLIVGGLVAEAVHDPAGAARGAASTAQGVHAAASMLVGEFAGIRV